MTDRKPDLNTLLHLSHRRNRATVGGGAETSAVSAALREMADPDRQDELPTRRHVPGRYHDLNQMLREALTARDDEGDDDAA